jgi:hypothetical protein
MDSLQIHGTPSQPNDVVRLQDIGGMTTTSHPNLTDLTINDDHPQYWRVSGRLSDILKITNTTPSSSTTMGAVVVAGGVGIYGDVNMGGKMTATQMTCQTAPVNPTDVARLHELPGQNTKVVGQWIDNTLPEEQVIQIQYGSIKLDL